MHTFGRDCSSHSKEHMIACLCENKDPECDSPTYCTNCGETEVGVWIYNEEGIVI